MGSSHSCNEKNGDKTPLRGQFGHLQNAEDETEDNQVISVGHGATAAALSNQRNVWQKGMKLEAKDLKYPTFICVATIDDVRSGKVLIHFDGWSRVYDYWSKTKAADLHPISYCAHKGIDLHKPKNYSGQFTWQKYLKDTNSSPVPFEAFNSKQKEGTTRSEYNRMTTNDAVIQAEYGATAASPLVQNNVWREGMKLEAKDIKNPTLICVATIDDVRPGEVLIHFDGWPRNYDYWSNTAAPELHPLFYCEHKGIQLQKPRFDNMRNFSWENYLQITKSVPVPYEYFNEMQKEGTPKSNYEQSTQQNFTDNYSSVVHNEWKEGMKLEAKDIQNPHLICVATIEKLRNGRVLIHFDGWTAKYNYWSRITASELHPLGYCDHKGLQLQKPKNYERQFSWQTYLNETNCDPVPYELFTQNQTEGTPSSQYDMLAGGSEVMTAENGASAAPPDYTQCVWKRGMKLEAKDIKNPSLICVATIDNVRQGAVLIHFDGWSKHYDYWSSTDAPELHPVAYCTHKKIDLQKPKGYKGRFSWNKYLKDTNSSAVLFEAFNSNQTEGTPRSEYNKSTAGNEVTQVELGATAASAASHQSMWKVGMKLEAKDIKNPTMICVATIDDIRPGEVLIHFDGWTEYYDYWSSTEAPELHPLSYCAHKGVRLEIPNGYSGRFTWSKYLEETRSTPVPFDAFNSNQTEGTPRSEYNKSTAGNDVTQVELGATAASTASHQSMWKVGMKLEAKDIKNPTLICVATIDNIRPGEVLIHFDGWTEYYDYWSSTEAPELHPLSYCAHTGIGLQKPNGYSGRFTWSKYLEETRSTPVPFDAFNSNQTGGTTRSEYDKMAGTSVMQQNVWKKGMKLEAKDIKNPTLICVATIDDVRPGEVLIHFDGWSRSYDYWSSTAAPELHPVYYCAHKGIELQKPADYNDVFVWETFLADTNSVPVPYGLFNKIQTEDMPTPDYGTFVGVQQDISSHEWKVGMKLEAVDKKYPDLICVATIEQVRSDSVLVHFDGWSSNYNYWSSKTALELHPVGYCAHKEIFLTKPYEYRGVFKWEDHLRKTNSVPVPFEFFTQDQTGVSSANGYMESETAQKNKKECSGWRVGMKLEAQWKHSPYCISVASVGDVEPGKVLIHFDSWPKRFDYWTNTDECDLHPCGYSTHMSLELRIPNGYTDEFNWRQYFIESNSVPVPYELFNMQQTLGIPALTLEGADDSSKDNQAELSGEADSVNAETEAEEKINIPRRDEDVCHICMENPIEITFGPCGHYGTCESCASNLEFCSICRKKIAFKLKTYKA